MQTKKKNWKSNQVNFFLRKNSKAKSIQYICQNLAVIKYWLGVSNKNIEALRN
jgi:hypothetical protein